MHRHTRLILILSIIALLVLGGLLWLLRYSAGLRGPAAVVPPPVADAAPQSVDVSTVADAAARAAFTSPDGPQMPAAAPEPAVEPEPADSADWARALQFAFEQGVVVPGGLSQEGSDALLRAEDFAQRVAEAAAESARDPEAVDMTRLYRDAIERSLRESGSRARLAGLACGTQLCVGALVDGGADDYRAWSDLFGKQGTAPVYAMNVYDAADAAGVSALRFTFVVDPDFSGIVVDGG